MIGCTASDQEEESRDHIVLKHTYCNDSDDEQDKGEHVSPVLLLILTLHLTSTRHLSILQASWLFVAC